MATLAPTSPPASPSRSRKSFARRCERCCCGGLAYFPLVFVYGLTTWAVYVEVTLGFLPSGGKWTGHSTSILGFVLYALANVSYTIAVFTSPGSPLEPISQSGSRSAGYASLPTQEPEQPSVVTYTSVAAKSSGRPRYCKKCQSVKPDRAHHCSTCNRCVLKMDHHCPWLATCVGLRNYKAFLLFLTYTSIFCWVCFAVTAQWVWAEITEETRFEESGRVVNTILLAVLSGIIGLVLSGFTGWHIYLAINGQTTIESLEKTRYLSPLKKSMEYQIQRGRHYVGQDDNGDEESAPFVDQLKEIHANVLPGITRPEEGEERDSNTSTPARSSHDSPAHASLRQSYANIEGQRERDRYSAYLDELDSEKLPHAFDMGWRNNLRHVFGENMLLWPLPVCNTTGDGWKWDVSQRWATERDEAARRRVQRQHEEQQKWQRSQSNGFGTSSGPNGAGRHYGHGNGPPRQWARGGSRSPQPLAMQTLDRRNRGGSEEGDEYDTSSDEDVKRGLSTESAGGQGRTENWNDIPDDFLSAGRTGTRSRSRGRQKGD